jgi:transcriptional regulator with XRE-family HTH domain
MIPLFSNNIVEGISMKGLRRLRQAARLTQVELAHRARIDRTRLSLAENGYVQLVDDERVRINKAVLATAKAHMLTLRKLKVQIT